MAFIIKQAYRFVANFALIGEVLQRLFQALLGLSDSGSLHSQTYPPQSINAQYCNVQLQHDIVLDAIA